ncbi:hypothetical protein M408DRAFT_65741 [Serendipita vermifera MAFF 305830]|uniref:TRP C-terminal domain-containing protein n=1 Tax=Serendipita vermifera MAFF 305830 TaxID=933852 RepID=A0A0C3BFC5_SERVB|nr:hypothetical protein M408DRAFT_65741 [Serendipita vermifera MAFF 305830]
MRVKQILAMFSIPANARLVYSRITASRLTTAFFFLALLHFLLQVSFQAWAYQINSSAGTFLSDILAAGNFAPHDFFAVLVPVGSDGKTGGELRLCNKDEMEAHEDIYQCPVTWRGRAAPPNMTEVDDGYGAVPTTPQADNVLPTTPEANSIITSTDDSGPTTTTSTRTRTSTTTSRTSTTVGSIPTSGGSSGQAGEDKESDDDEEEYDDRRRSAKRSLSLRDIPVETVFNMSLVQPGSSATETTVAGVLLPNMMNPTSGTMGVVLSEQCVQMIIWPNQIIHNTKREDLTFIGFQIWVFGMSVVAILNESIPHTLAALATHLLTAAWSGYQLVNTASFQSEFVRSTIRSGLCGRGVNLLPNYWVERRAAEVSVLVVNGVSLLISAALSWRLVKMFGWQTFKRIGASLEINRIYKIVLIFSIGLQVAFFFIIVGTALWLDVLFSTILGETAENAAVYKAFAILACLVTLPWLCLGWFAVRREMQKMMCLFLAASFLLVAAWGTLFMSRTFRWSFMEWRFFATMSVASAALLVLTTILGIVCFYNFGKGLKRFLPTAEEQTFDHENFQRVTSRDMEKAEVVDFPVSGPIPTYAVAFGNSAKSQQQSSVERSTTVETSSSMTSSSLGSPLHDPMFFDPAPDYPHLSIPTSNLPPRFRSREHSIAEPNGSSLSGGAVSRGDSTTSSESGSNPFSLDTETRRNSAGSGTSGRSYGTNKSPKTYAKPGSLFTPPKHVRDISQAGSLEGNKRWVID